MPFDELCRACLLNIDGSKKYVFFKDVSAYTFWFCTSIQVLETESLPKMLCCSCYELVSEFAKFKQKCIDAQQSLLNFESIKAETQASELVGSSYEENREVKKTTPTDVSKHFSDDDNIKCELKIEQISNKSYSSDDNKQDIENCMPKNEINSNTSNKDFFCDACNKFFVTKRKYKIHKNNHVTKLCIPCNKVFKRQSFYRHNRTKHSQFSFRDTQCNFCGKVFKHIITLRQHVKTQHGVTNKYVCDICGKISTSQSSLKLHIDRHSETKEPTTIYCEQCNKQFKSKTAVQEHFKRVHTGKQYICDYCNFSYKYKDNLVKHLLTHEGKKLHKCKFCNKSFSTRTYYVEHQRLHSGERPFNCSYCPKSFVSKRRLNDHHVIHTGERKHKCRICEQRFTQLGSVKRHMKIHNKMPLA